ncbi:MAG: hypothetical protein JXR77_04045 [Lentisphaeria bacterium]|nr:hypothetical protein [Lentisphaeria bacterium]
MKTLRIAAAIAVLAAAGWGLWRWLRPTEEKVIRGRLEDLADCVSRRDRESTPIMGLKMTSLQGFFAPEVSIAISGFPGEARYTAAQLASEVARARPYFSVIELTFFDVEVAVQDHGNATLSGTARLVLVSADGGERTEETRVVHCRLSRDEGPWQFAAFSEEPLLRR